ncbi:MAG TPA: YraN family protein [Alphaproteobacteria bacterium]|nr:YraN family protein [Alphaproteobacteria bacterium]
MRLPLNPRKRAYLKGQWGEKVASVYLRFKGYEILESRFKTPVGEIDLLVRKGKTLVAIEVKNRLTLEKASMAVTPFQKRRIERALLYYLSRHPFSLDLRFDVILICPWKWPCHIQGAWLSQ